jgi:hypothetical protein
MMSACESMPLPLPLPTSTPPSVRWFSAYGCVAEREGEFEVWLGGTLVGHFGPGDRGVRNAILVGLAGDPKMHLGALADAFGISSEALRQVRRAYEDGGLEVIVSQARAGRQPKVTAPLRQKLEKLFEGGASVSEALEAVRRRHRVGRATVGRVRRAWDLARAKKAAQATARAIETMPELPLSSATVSNETTEQPGDAKDAASRNSDQPETITAGSTEEQVGADDVIEPAPVEGGRFVQHLGTWLLLATVAHLGLHRRAMAAREDRVEAGSLRIALDAVIMALAIGQGCVEGVRRLATPSAGKLLRADHAPSASWARRVLGRFASFLGGARLHLGMAGEYLQAHRADVEHAAVFYVDNHMRPYTGQHVVRKGWRMQDKRAMPGATDYYVHDEDGRPVLRVDVPSHGSLTDWLSPIAKVLRLALPDQTLVLGFDRAGAFPAQMADLRDEGFDFVTYERRPFPLLTDAAFDQRVCIDDETMLFTESRINLGGGKGRLRRIAVRMPDGRQVNLLATGEQPPERLIEIMRGRWVQENGFKHGVERWGINQLDGRRTDTYPPDTIVPNPARRRLDRAIRIASVREGDARCRLAQLADGDPKRARLVQEIDQAVAQQRELQAQRPSTPQRAALKDTELANDLVRHTSEYKTTIDTIRIACANAESDLAGELAPHLDKPAEAKKALANLLASPGHVRVAADAVEVTLLPAGTRDERAAFEHLLDTVSGWKLTLPGDPRRRPLRFRSQL